MSPMFLDDDNTPLLSDLVEELLGMTPDLRAAPSTDVVLHLLPVLAKEPESSQKLFMLIACPTANLAGTFIVQKEVRF